MSKTKWSNSIVGRQMLPVGDITPHPENWRIHPVSQRLAIQDVLQEIGWVTGVIYNKTTGHLLDGHMRVEEAIKAGEAEVPATIVELSAEDELKALAFLDPTTNEAIHDQDMLDELNEEAGEMRQTLKDLLADAKETREEDKTGAEMLSDIGARVGDIDRTQNWVFGHITVQIPYDDYVDFRETLYQDVGFKRMDVLHEIMQRLGFTTDDYKAV